jgi:hypothetical protein
VSLFKQRKNRAFNYIPRGNQSSLNDDLKLKTQWESLKDQDKRKTRRMTSLPVLLIILGMIIALFYILMQYETI